MPLLLPDGQTWWLYEPWPVAVTCGDTTAVLLDWGLPEAENVALTDAVYKGLRRLAEATTAEERAASVLSVAFVMLYRNYRVNGSDFNAMLTAGPIGVGLWGRLEAMVERMAERAAILTAA